MNDSEELEVEEIRRAIASEQQKLEMMRQEDIQNIIRFLQINPNQAIANVSLEEKKAFLAQIKRENEELKEELSVLENDQFQFELTEELLNEVKDMDIVSLIANDMARSRDLKTVNENLNVVEQQLYVKKQEEKRLDKKFQDTQVKLNEILLALTKSQKSLVDEITNRENALLEIFIKLNQTLENLEVRELKTITQVKLVEFLQGRDLPRVISDLKEIMSIPAYERLNANIEDLEDVRSSAKRLTPRQKRRISNVEQGVRPAQQKPAYPVKPPNISVPQNEVKQFDSADLNSGIKDQSKDADIQLLPDFDFIVIPTEKTDNLKDRTADAPMPFAVKSPSQEFAMPTSTSLENSASSIKDSTDKFKNDVGSGSSQKNSYKRIDSEQKQKPTQDFLNTPKLKDRTKDAPRPYNPTQPTKIAEEYLLGETDKPSQNEDFKTVTETSSERLLLLKQIQSMEEEVKNFDSLSQQVEEQIQENDSTFQAHSEARIAIIFMTEQLSKLQEVIIHEEEKKSSELSKEAKEFIQSLRLSQFKQIIADLNTSDYTKTLLSLDEVAEMLDRKKNDGESQDRELWLTIGICILLVIVMLHWAS